MMMPYPCHTSHTSLPSPRTRNSNVTTIIVQLFGHYVCHLPVQCTLYDCVMIPVRCLNLKHEGLKRVENLPSVPAFSDRQFDPTLTCQSLSSVVKVWSLIVFSLACFFFWCLRYLCNGRAELWTLMWRTLWLWPHAPLLLTTQSWTCKQEILHS